MIRRARLRRPLAAPLDVSFTLDLQIEDLLAALVALKKAEFSEDILADEMQELKKSGILGTVSYSRASAFERSLVANYSPGHPWGNDGSPAATRNRVQISECH